MTSIKTRLDGKHQEQDSMTRKDSMTGINNKIRGHASLTRLVDKQKEKESIQRTNNKNL